MKVYRIWSLGIGVGVSRRDCQASRMLWFAAAEGVPRLGFCWELGWVVDALLSAVLLVGVETMKVEALMGLGKHEEAYTLSSVLIRSSQNNPALLITRARCLYLMGNLESAVKHLQVSESILV